MYLVCQAWQKLVPYELRFCHVYVPESMVETIDCTVGIKFVQTPFMVAVIAF